MSIKLAAAAAVLCLAPGLAFAQSAPAFSKGDFIVTGRVTSVTSDASDPITTAAGAASGLHIDVGSSVVPTLGFTYFLTDNISVEAILGASHHDIRAKGPGTDVLVHETWVLPPVVTLQYRPLPGARVSPYVGAGVNAMVFFGGKDRNGFDVSLDNAVGWAVQAGVDAPINERWSLNADVKKVFVKSDASINGGALKSEVQLDPWVVSVGLGRRF